MNENSSQQNQPPRQRTRIKREVVHELNNQLAIIDSQAGLIRDMLDPALGMDSSPEALRAELDEIDTSVKMAKAIIQDIRTAVHKMEEEMEEGISGKM